MKLELIKYVMGEANKCYADDFPIHKIEEWIKEFFDRDHCKESCMHPNVCKKCGELKGV